MSEKIGDYNIIREYKGITLLGRGDGRRTVVRVYGEYRHQVMDAMPGDAPRGGGNWNSSATTGGVDYVAKWYSRGYANRVFRTLVNEVLC